MKIILLNTDPDLCIAWRSAFAGIESVQIAKSNFEPLIDLFDCLVSPANSFGFMDGGMDAAITDFFGTQLEERVQDEIWRCHRGEQPVGTCLIVPTADPRCPWLAHCPTMRTPMDVSGTNNAYAAFLAALTTAEAQGIQTLACSGLATGTGQMPPEVAARQMRFAFDSWSSPFIRQNWTSVEAREWQSHGRTRTEFLKRWIKLRNL
jgi:O-acetyl-ADP-ribose deacetylase (regulator of RNase III)